MALPQSREYYTAQEIADHLRISKMTVLRACERGDLKHLRVGKVVRIPAKAAHHWIRTSTGGFDE